MNLNELNREQRLAAETTEGPVLILAGAGSGKTRALTYRVANLIDHGVPSWHILALTFTNKAAQEMKSRIEVLVGEEAAKDAWIGTFHSACARILRRDIEKIGYSRSFTIYDDEDQKSVIREILKNLNIDEEYLDYKTVRSNIGDAKNALLSPDEWFMRTQRDRRSSLIHDVMCEYEKRLRSLNALDFDDLLLRTLELLADHPPVLQSYRNRFRYIMVDEYQDTNRAQYELIRLLSAEHRNLCVVGDDDQSIYGWRGADIRNILDFEKDYPDATVIKLEQNYRSTSTILDAANQVIAHNEGRKDKTLWTQIGEGEKIHFYAAEDERDEAAWIADRVRSMHREGSKLSDIAVLYRTNAQARVLEDTMVRAGIPYRVFGGQKFYERKEIKDIIAYLRVIANPSDDVSLLRIINTPRRSIGDSTIQELTRHAAAMEMPLYSALSDLPEGLGSRPRKCVTDFFLIMTTLSAMKDTLPLEDFIRMLVEKTGLREQYVRDRHEEARARIENIDEFLGGVHEFVTRSDETPTLEDYLENVALVTDQDRSEDGRGCITLMTLHSAKGLEFRTVFMAGVEENIFPSFRSVESQSRLEEERRLMYVGITRARDRLFISWARRRALFNRESFNEPSRFLQEIPDRLVDRTGFNRRDQFFDRSPVSPAVPRSARSAVPEPEYRKPVLPVGQIGKPKLTFQGKSLDQIPGVTRGFAPSKAREMEESAVSRLYQTGDRVLHRKFGAGVVRGIQGSGAEARITIEFTAWGTKEFSLSIAPIVKLED